VQRELSRFFAHSGVYALGNLIYRGASFVLIPLYVHYLTPAEYGTLEILTITGTIVQTLLGASVAHSVLRFYYEYTERADRNAVVSSALIGSMAVALTGVMLLSPFTGRISHALFGTADWAVALRLVLLTIAFELSREISLAYLRATERSWMFVALSVCQLCLQVAANVFTVVHLRLGAVGIVMGNLATAVVIWALLTQHTMRECGFNFRMKQIRAIVQYGHPLMLAGIVSSVLNSSDRYFLNAYISAAYAGVYALALRIVQVVPVLLTDPFTRSFGPFRFSIMRQENAGAIYSRVLLYYAGLSGLATFTLASMAPELVRAISTDDYGAAADVLPVLLVPAALQGVIYIFQTGSYVQKHTRAILYAVTISSVTNFGLNLLLIPRFHLFGAATAAACAALVNVCVTYLLGQRAVVIKYAPGRALTLLALSISGGILLAVAHQSGHDVALPVRLAVLAFYAVMVARFADLTPSRVRAMWRQLSASRIGVPPS
jgi:O-antigen/teichoic acid export membrane protein